MSPVRARSALATVALTLAACSVGSEHRVQHPEEPGPAPTTPSSRVSAGVIEAAPESASTAPESQADPGAELEREVSAAPRRELPTACDKQGALCLPPAEFVDRACRAPHVGTAIRLFAKSSPFTRAYVRMREVRAANLRGGPVGDSNLKFAEEVLILAQHGGSGELQVSGTGGFDVLRWDGTCATLSDDELVMQVPAPPRHAQFAWNYIDDGIQEALLQNAAIRSARASERKSCRGMSQAQRSASCREAAERLNDHIVVAIRTGMDLPLPEYAP